MTFTSLAAAALLASSLPAGAPPLRFSIPSGWVDGSPGAPEQNLERLPPAALAEARSGKFAALAFDLDHAREGFAASLNVIVNDGRVEVTEAGREENAAMLVAEIRKAVPSVVLRESRVLEIGGVRCLQTVYDTDQQGYALRQMAVIMPAGSQIAVATYTALRASFDDYREVFESSARATVGLAEAPGRGIDFGRAAWAGLVGAVIGALVAAVGAVLKRRSKPAPRLD